uniref:Smr domain-containing protein n=3 Tax=Ditylum brightwellii TaxID=49249 RepID=A0A7S4RNZ8_9STRA
MNSNTTFEEKTSVLEQIIINMDRSERHVKISGPIFESLIRTFGTNRQYKDARRVFNMIEGPTNAGCLSAVLYACSAANPSRWRDATDILHSSDIVAGASGPARIESLALSYAVIACARENEWKEALNLIDLYGLPNRIIPRESRSEWDQKSYPVVSVDALNSIIAACGRSGCPDMAVKLLNEMPSKYGVCADDRSYRSAIIACNQAEHEKQRQIRIKSELKTNGSSTRGGREHASAYIEKTVHTNKLNLQWWECALSLLRRMKEEELKPDPQTYSSVISACEAAGQWQRALGILRSMSKDSTIGRATPPNLFCVNAAISACEKGGAWLEAFELYERMKNRGGAVRPNFITISSLLIALESAGQRELAENTYKEALREGMVSPWKKRIDIDGQTMRMMDLHQYSAPMAKIAVRSVIESLLKPRCAHDISKDFVVIVGRGKGSEGGRPVLLPVIQQMLQSEFGVMSNIDESNSGRLRVKREELESFVKRKGWRL